MSSLVECRGIKDEAMRLSSWEVPVHPSYLCVPKKLEAVMECDTKYVKISVSLSLATRPIVMEREGWRPILVMFPHTR